MNRRKLLAGLGALVLALLSTVVLVKYVQGAKERALAGEDLVNVLVVKKDIKAGTLAADLTESVVAEQVQAKIKATNAVTSFAQIDGLITAVDLVEGEQLLTTRFVNAASFQGARSASVRIPEDANEVTFKLTPERALGGQLRPGDTVSVVASFEPFDNEAVDPATGDLRQLAKSPNTSHILLNNVVVIRIQFPENANTSSKEKNGIAVAPTEDILVTLAVDQPSLERAVFAAEFGKIWLSYEPKTANATKNREVIRGKVYEQTESLLTRVNESEQVGVTVPIRDPASTSTTTTVATPSTKKK